MCEKYIKDGKMAVLVSYGFGAGWSTQTWGQQELCYDKRVVEFWLKHKDNKAYIDALDSYGENSIKEEAERLFKSWGYESVYFGGFADIHIVWVPLGIKFVILEYDGAEHLQTIDDFKWITA